MKKTRKNNVYKGQEGTRQKHTSDCYAILEDNSSGKTLCFICSLQSSSLLDIFTKAKRALQQKL